MTYGESGGLSPAPEQLELLQTGRNALQVLEACTPELPPEEPDPEDVAWAEAHNLVFWDPPRSYSYVSLPTPDGDTLNVYVYRSTEEPSVEAIVSAGEVHELSEAPEGLRDLLVCFRGIAQVTRESAPNTQDEYMVWEVVGGPVMLRGTALISYRPMKYVESFIEVTPSLNATITDRMVEAGLYDDTDPHEPPLFDNVGCQDIIPMSGFMGETPSRLLGQRDAEELHALLLAACLHGEPINAD